jgi:hypothetical protein
MRAVRQDYQPYSMSTIIMIIIIIIKLKWEKNNINSKLEKFHQALITQTTQNRPLTTTTGQLTETLPSDSSWRVFKHGPLGPPR